MMTARIPRNSDPAPAGVLIAGCGPAGSSVAWHLNRLGHPVRTVFDISRPRALRLKKLLRNGPRAAVSPRSLTHPADMIIIAVPDDAVSAVRDMLMRSGSVRQGTAVFHLSGILPAEVLAPLRTRGAVVAALHPVRPFTFAAPAEDDFNGCSFDVQGDAEACQRAAAIVQAWGGSLFIVDSQIKELLHVASVFSSNFINVLLGSANKILGAGKPQKALPLNVLQSLAQAALSNSFNAGPEKALTGPVKRGDAETIRRHLEVLEENAPELVPLYRLLSLAAAEMAAESTGSRRGLQIILKLLQKQGHLHKTVPGGI